MHSTKESSDRDLLREQQRLARHAQAQLADDRSEAKNNPLFGEPIKVSKFEEDATSRRIRETLGDYKQALSIFGNCSKPGAPNPRAKGSRGQSNGETGNVKHEEAQSLQQKNSVFNSHKSLPNGVSYKEVPSSQKPAPCNNNQQEKGNVSSKDKINQFSNHDRTDVSVVQSHQSLQSCDSDVPGGGARTNAHKTHSSVLQKEVSLKVNINNASEISNKNDVKDVESILQEMQCVVPTPLTAIGTPRTEENQFSFPTVNNVICDDKQVTPNRNDVNISTEENIDKDRPFKSVTQKKDLQTEDGENEFADFLSDAKTDQVFAAKELMLSPLKDSENGENMSSSSGSSASSSDSDDSSSASESDADEPSPPPPNEEVTRQSDSSELSVHSQHSNSSNNLSWNLASFIKPAHSVTSDNSMSARSNRESAPYDPVGDEGPFGSVQSILSSLSSAGEDDHPKNDPLSPVPVNESIICDKDKMREMVDNMAEQVNNLPTSCLLSPVPTPRHSYADDLPFGPNSAYSAHPGASRGFETKKSTDDGVKTSENKPDKQTLPKLSAPKIDKGRTTPSKVNGSSNKRRKSSKFKSAEFLPEDSSNNGSDDNSDVDILNTPSPVKMRKRDDNSSHNKSSKTKSAAKQLFKPAGGNEGPELAIMSPLKNSPHYKPEKENPKPKHSKEIKFEPLSQISDNSNHVANSPPSSVDKQKKRQIIVHLDLGLIDRLPGRVVATNVPSPTGNQRVSEHEKENRDDSYITPDNAPKNKSNKNFECQTKDENLAENFHKSSSKSKHHKRKHVHADDRKSDKRNKASSISSLEGGGDVVSKKTLSQHKVNEIKKPAMNGSQELQPEISNAQQTNEDKAIVKKSKHSKKKEHKSKRKEKKPDAKRVSESDVKIDVAPSLPNGGCSPAHRVEETVKSSVTKTEAVKDASSLSVRVKPETSTEDKAPPSQSKDDASGGSSSTGKKRRLPEDGDEPTLLDAEVVGKKLRKEGAAVPFSAVIGQDLGKKHKPKHDESRKKNSDRINISSSQSQTSNNLESDKSANKTHQKPALLPSSNPIEKSHRSSDFYLLEAKALKHQADREENRTAQAMKYLEAVLYFILTGNAMENSQGSNHDPTFRMYKDTLTLIRFISSKFRSSQNSSMASVDNKLAVLSLRVQSLLQLKLFQMKKGEIKDFHKIFADYQKNPSKFTPTLIQNGVVNNNNSKQLSQPSPGQPNSNTTNGWINNGKTTGTPSPMSPTPSPAGSVGSQSSGYSSSDVPLSQAKPFSAASLAANSSSQPITVPNPHFTSFLQNFTRQYVNMQHAVVSHDLWDQADALIIRTKCQDFFQQLDEQCNKLTLHTSLTDLVKYVTEGLHQLKAT